MRAPVAHGHARALVSRARTTEMVMGGSLVETNRASILDAVKALDTVAPPKE